MLYNLVNYACQSVSSIVSFTFLMGGGFVSAKYLKLKEDINEIYKAAIRSKLAYSTKVQMI